MCIPGPVLSQNSKNAIFVSLHYLEMLEITVRKMTSSTGTVFGLYICQNRYIKLKFGMLDAQALFYNMLCVLFENFGYKKKLYKNVDVSSILGYKNLFLKNLDSHLKELLILRFWCLFFEFYFQSIFLVILQTFINF